MSTQRLTTHEPLPLHSRQRITQRSQRQHDRRGNQARRIQDQRQPLHYRHDGVDGGAHVVCFEAADELVELFGGRADAEEEGDFEEEDDEGADSGGCVSDGMGRSGVSRRNGGGKDGGLGASAQDVQADDAEDDDEAEVEDVCYTQRET